MKSCNIFLFVVFNLKIRESDNKKMLDELYHQMSIYRGIPAQAFIKKCLFIINFDKNQDTSDKSLNQAKNDIISVVDGLNELIFKDLNVSFFNAKFYENYIFKLKYYESAEKLINYESREYKKMTQKRWSGLIDMVKGGTFSKYLKDQLKDNIGNDVKEKFNEKTVKPNENIENELKTLNNIQKLKLSEKDIKLISKYITFGKENISKSNLLPDSKIDSFATQLLISNNRDKIKEDEEINYNLKKCFKILDDIFEVDPNTKFGSCKDAPIAKVVKPHIQEDLNKMKYEIESLLNTIHTEFSNNDIAKKLDKCSENIENSLKDQKSNIKNSLLKKNWKDIQKNFEETFKKETTNLETELLSNLNSLSDIIQKYLDQCYNHLDNFYSKPIERKSLLFKNYISNCLGEENNIEKTIKQVIDDIINGSRTSTNYNEKDGIFNWLGSKLFDDSYLNKIIDYMIQNSIPRIKKFSDEIKTHADKFKKSIIDEITSSKNRVVQELKDKKKKEELEIKSINAKNEKERQKWEEEKAKLEEEKKKWEQLCKKYRILRDEITSLRLTKEFETEGKN